MLETRKPPKRAHKRIRARHSSSKLSNIAYFNPRAKLSFASFVLEEDFSKESPLSGENEFSVFRQLQWGTEGRLVYVETLQQNT